MSGPERGLPTLGGLGSNYQMVRELGRGGTAVVYLARDTDLERDVAVKVIRSTFVEDEEAMARLTREARTVAALQHPNIVMLYGTRRLEDNSLALIMQFVPGRSLKDLIRLQGPMTYDRVGQILMDVAAALSYAHRRRIVHRDIKPENIYVDEEAGVARLSDFGIARPWDTDSSLTLPGMALGTPAYMSPEQIDGRDLDGRSDLYSLGLVGYEMLTGHQPWAGENLYTVIYRQKQDSLPRLGSLRSDIPPHLERAIDVALEKNRDDRWANAEDFIQQILSGPLPATPPPRDLKLALEARATDEGAAEEANTIMYRRPDLDSDGDEVGEVRERSASSASAVAAPDASVDAVPSEPTAPPGRRRRRKAGAWLMVASVVALAGVSWSMFRSSANGNTDPDASPVPATASGTGAGPVDSAAAGGDGVPGDAGSATPDDSPAVDAPTGAPPAVASMTAFAGNAQDADPGTLLANPLVVRVADEQGDPVEGAVVQFAAVSGGGILEPDRAASDANGFASTQWLLGLADGPQQVTAVVEGSDVRQVLFTANADASPAAVTPAAATLVEGDAQEATVGTALPRPLVLEVTGADGRPMEGVSVRFEVTEGGGRLTPAEATTDVSGRARANWILGPGALQQRATVVVRGLEERPITVGALGIPRPLRIRRTMVTGATHTCALTAEGMAYCWGGNQNGQLGDGGGSRRSTPGLVDGALTLAVLSGGFLHTCGIRPDGRALCWGANESGQLGDGTTRSSTAPVPVAGDLRFASLGGGTSHTCALVPDGTAFCWGANANGQLGDGSRASRPSPGQVGGGRRFSSLAVGWTHTCALTRGGSAYCWGRNAHGQIGDGSLADRLVPTAVTEVPAFRALSAGSAHTCGVTTEGDAYCWGQNLYGQLGDGTTQNSRVPVKVEGLQRVSAIAAGGVHTCALTEAGAAYCWGRNTYGQLGDGTQQDRTSPVPVADEIVFASLYASGAHTCGATSTGRSYCWGYNVDGQLGDGSRSNRSTPTPVLRLPR